MTIVIFWLYFFYDLCLFYPIFPSYRHGDIVYITFTEPTTELPPTNSLPDNSGNLTMQELTHLKQDPVDDFLEKQRGLIKRKRDTKLYGHI